MGVLLKSNSLIQSVLCASRHITNVLQGKQCNRCRYVQRILSSRPWVASYWAIWTQNEGYDSILAILQTVNIDQTYDNPIAVMAVDEVICLMRKIDDEIQHGKLGMIAQHSLGYHFMLFFKWWTAKLKLIGQLKLFFSRYYFQNISSILKTITNKKVVNL